MASAYELRFDYEKLDDARKKSLDAVLAILLSDGGCKIEVEPVEFPDELRFNIETCFGGCGFVVVWDAEKSTYRFLIDAHKYLLSFVLSDTCGKRLSELLMR
ncbi:hypothetical protein ES705_11337 [subsurface metagenome]